MGRLVALVLSLACLAMVLVTVVTGRQNRAMQDRLQKKADALREEQATLQEGTSALAQIEQRSQGILQDMGTIALSNVEMRVLLAKNGITLSTDEAPAGAKAPEEKTEAPASTNAVVLPKPAKAAAVEKAKPVVEVVSPPVGVGDAGSTKQDEEAR